MSNENITFTVLTIEGFIRQQYKGGLCDERHSLPIEKEIRQFVIENPDKEIPMQIIEPLTKHDFFIANYKVYIKLCLDQSNRKSCTSLPPSDCISTRETRYLNQEEFNKLLNDKSKTWHPIKTTKH